MEGQHKRTGKVIFASIIFSFIFLLLYSGVEARTITADVVALDQPIMFNRLGAQNVNGMMFALKRDVVPINAGGGLVAGNVMLRPDKRPRPLVLRVAAGDTLVVTLTNLLTPAANPFNLGIGNPLNINEQVADRYVGFHPQGMQLVRTIDSDSSYVGKNANSLVAQGGTPKTYTFYAEKEGTFPVTSYGASFGSEGLQGNSANGLFAVINVEPAGANFYRSQLTEEEMRLAATNPSTGVVNTTAAGQPIVNYEARYPNEPPWSLEGKGGLPILNMLNGTELVHSDINAIIVGSGSNGTFPASTYPSGNTNPTLPNRLEPFREFTVVFHDEVATAQAFPGFYTNMLHTLAGVKDGFMINYGSGGIGSEIIANRLGVGPMHDCLTCAYEEFFLTSYAVGDPAMVVDVPANTGLESFFGPTPPAGTTGPKATEAFYPDDPSNVHHSYINDFVKFRNVHVGKEQHVFHLHNHQWLFNPNDDNANYLDANGVGPGSGYTYEINFGGAGNRNKSAGDAIFHCHFYPHFAQGMWELFRIHDVFEKGTLLEVSGGAGSFHPTSFALMYGKPAAGARALPDGEIVAGTPIPAVVPLPGKPMAVMPGRVEVVANANTTTASTFHATSPGAVVPVGSLANVIDREINPGFPFWIAGIEHTVGQRPPTPPLDMLTEAQALALKNGSNPLFAGRDMSKSAGGWDGGLPRHSLDGITAAGHTPDDPAFVSTVSRLDFSKVIHKAKPVWFPEQGTDVEQTAMAFHAQKFHDTYLPDGTAATGTSGFRTNGAPPMPSAPYHDPCIDDKGRRLDTSNPSPQFFSGNGGTSTLGYSSPFNADNPRVYKGANIQFDAVFNKLGYHYPQQRIIALWDDVLPTINKTRPPEPLVMRMNTFDCVKYLHTNLVPEAFELDDYQVRTPTDIIGQHIHLPKWDLTTTDGSANGWNYEDGTLSPGAVRERIHAINEYNLHNTPVTLDVQGSPVKNSEGTPIGATLKALNHSYFPASGPGGANWLGARTTIQRWFSDPVVNAAGDHRGLGIIFTHDHYGPSTHQQIGLYATVLNEPPGSTWRHNETGVVLGTRHDGGPTSWQAAIVTPNSAESHREFYIEYSDFQHAYEAGVYVGANQFGAPTPGAVTANTFRNAINPSVRPQLNPVFPDLYFESAICPDGSLRPCPEAISVSDPGMLVVNYRNEPVGLRVYDPNKIGPDGKLGSQADGPAGDLAFALQTRIDRKIPQLNTRLGNTPYPALTNDIKAGDPFTPIMRVYAGDLVRVKIQAGGHEEEHNASIHGVKWLQGGSGFGKSPTSGWRNAQAAGISEQFTFFAPVTPVVGTRGATADYAYTVDASMDGWWSGMWGLLRSYNNARPDIFKLSTSVTPLQIANSKDFNGVCPVGATPRNYDITAVLANKILNLPVDINNNPLVTIIPGDNSATMHVGSTLDPAGGTLMYNPDVGPANQGPLHDPTAILYVRTADLDATGKLKPGVPVEPLVLRAAAGECINVTLRNGLPGDVNLNGFFDDNPDLSSYSLLQGVVKRNRGIAGDPGSTTFQNNLIRPSSYVGLHPQLVAYDVTRSDGVQVGTNPDMVVPPGGQKTFQWYAGDLSTSIVPAGKGFAFKITPTPVEFGGSNLIPADKIKQGQKGLVGALVIEPNGSTWTEDVNDPAALRKTRTAATVTPPTPGVSFRDFSLVFQKNLSLRYGDGSPVEHLNGEALGLPEDSQEGSHMAINYGTEPLWFRFGLPPNAPFGNTAGGFGGVSNAHEAYSNSLVSEACTGDPTLPECDPVTPVFKVAPGQPFRMHVGVPHGTSRGTTFNLHGHLWQRDPYLAGTVPSQTIGDNPISMYLGGQESITPFTHFDFVFPKAGGANAVSGDYLFRDQASMGNMGGLWGILRVE